MFTPDCVAVCSCVALRTAWASVRVLPLKPVFPVPHSLISTLICNVGYLWRMQITSIWFYDVTCIRSCVKIFSMFMLHL